MYSSGSKSRTLRYHFCANCSRRIARPAIPNDRASPLKNSHIAPARFLLYSHNFLPPKAFVNAMSVYCQRSNKNLFTVQSSPSFHCSIADLENQLSSHSFSNCLCRLLFSFLFSETLASTPPSANCLTTTASTSIPLNALHIPPPPPISSFLPRVSFPVHTCMASNATIDLD